MAIIERPEELRLHPPPPACLASVHRARKTGREIEYTDDFVVKPLPIGGQGARNRPVRVANRAFEPARAFRRKARISNEDAWRKPVQIKEGRLCDPFAIGCGQRESATNIGKNGCPQGRRILKSIEGVPAQREVGGNRTGVSAPF